MTYIIRRFLHLLYHQLAWAYDYIAYTVSFGKWKDWILSILPLIKGPNIIELGHGPGHFMLANYLRNVKIVGIDESIWMSRQAYNRLKKQGFNPLIVNAVAQSLPFEENNFDQIVATFPTDFILDFQTLEEVHRLLRKRGEIIYLLSAGFIGDNWYFRFLRWVNKISGQSSYSGDVLSIPEFDGLTFRSKVVETHDSVVNLVIGTKK